MLPVEFENQGLFSHPDFRTRHVAVRIKVLAKKRPFLRYFQFIGIETTRRRVLRIVEQA